MGEVWPRDTRLGREGAIKTLPEEFAKDVGRLARVERGAKLLASLNHPNIVAIHGFEDDACRTTAWGRAPGLHNTPTMTFSPLPCRRPLLKPLIRASSVS